jgi:hypothetical protein
MFIEKWRPRAEYVVQGMDSRTIFQKSVRERAESPWSDGKISQVDKTKEEELKRSGGK